MYWLKDGPVKVGESNSDIPGVQAEYASCPLLQLWVVCEWVLKMKNELMQSCVSVSRFILHTVPLVRPHDRHMFKWKLHVDVMFLPGFLPGPSCICAACPPAVTKQRKLCHEVAGGAYLQGKGTHQKTIKKLSGGVWAAMRSDERYDPPVPGSALRKPATSVTD